MKASVPTSFRFTMKSRYANGLKSKLGLFLVLAMMPQALHAEVSRKPCMLGGVEPARALPSKKAAQIERSVVKLTSNQNWGSYMDCSATLVTPDSFLTSCNCVMPFGDMGYRGRVYLHTMNGDRIDAISVSLDPKCEKVLLESPDDMYVYRSDLAIVKVDPARVKSLGLRPIRYREASKADRGAKVTLVGYGRVVRNRRAKVQNAPLLVQTRVTGFRDTKVVSACDDGKATWEGDAGGPALVEEGGKFVVIGVNSNGRFSGLLAKNAPIIACEGDFLDSWAVGELQK